jgi:saccharopine dehydrogenase (NADP+, L-glutamate forming)
MKRIFIFGAGKSAFYTIKYLAHLAHQGLLQLTVADSSTENLEHCRNEFPLLPIVSLDVMDEPYRRQMVESHDIIISLLPARFHSLLAQDCLTFGKNFINPSYLTPELLSMNAEAVSKGLLFINELGLDPGIDHMSAMDIIHRLISSGTEITSFKSWCGGLVAPESDNNPWHYKFSWAPANVLRAGYDGALYLLNRMLHYVPYHRLFSEITEVSVPGSNSADDHFEGYLNRDSSRYIPIYGLQNAATFIRGTLRSSGFCAAWNHLLQSGLTTDRINVNTSSQPLWKDFLQAFEFPETSDPHIHKTMEWTFSGERVAPYPSVHPVAVLQELLEKKLAMQPQDKDRVVMIHQFEYSLDNQNYRLTSWMDIIGDDAIHTAMAKTVGLPLALAAERMATGLFRSRGVVLPVIPEIYTPLLQSLRNEGIFFQEITEKI